MHLRRRGTLYMDPVNFETPKKLYTERENPCGHICEPLNPRYCLLVGTNEPVVEAINTNINNLDNKFQAFSLAQAICRMHVEVLVSKADCEENKDTAEFWKSVSENLIIDTNTGLYTGKGFEAILEELYSPDVLNPLIKKGFTLRVMYADVNDLKKHNELPGGHERGDMAIQTIGKALSEYAKNSRRKNMHINGANERRSAVKIPRVIAARSNDKGDEFVILSLSTNSGAKSLEKNKEELETLLKDLKYTYGGVTYEVSATFGLTELRIPASIATLKSVINLVDSAMLEHKKTAKQTNGSLGVIVRLANRH